LGIRLRVNLSRVHGIGTALTPLDAIRVNHPPFGADIAHCEGRPPLAARPGLAARTGPRRYGRRARPPLRRRRPPLLRPPGPAAALRALGRHVLGSDAAVGPAAAPPDGCGA